MEVFLWKKKKVIRRPGDPGRPELRPVYQRRGRERAHWTSWRPCSKRRAASASGRILQNRHEPDPHSFIGEGKAEEVREWVQNDRRDARHLRQRPHALPQVRARSRTTKAHVLDRSALILDIFALRAKTREGKLQVELAQYKYYLPRLTTWNEEMGRLGGGIGTRGPGETKLETDRRHIRARISKLQSELKEVRKIRAVQRERRMKNDVPVICLVGYTNAGKSTLLNALTGAGIPANNRLFDTLDTTSRQLTVSDTCRGDFVGHGRLHREAAAPSGRGVQGNARGAAIRRPSAFMSSTPPTRTANDHIRGRRAADRPAGQARRTGDRVL